jgi:hypothetical protein
VPTTAWNTAVAANLPADIAKRNLDGIADIRAYGASPEHALNAKHDKTAGTIFSNNTCNQ